MSIGKFPAFVLLALLFGLGSIACSNENHDKYDYEENYGENYETEGIITSIVNSQSFFLGSTLVVHDSSTRFEYGNANDPRSP